MSVPTSPQPDDRGRWRVLGFVCAGIVMSMASWFSATAITPELARIWTLSPGQVSWSTNAVQIGFVVGALASSLVSLPDLVALRMLALHRHPEGRRMAHGLR